MSSATDRWNTPPEVIERVIRVLGVIDLDPCADPEANVPASRHFTITDNGLAQVWRGRVYMNPPYGRETGLWVAKLTGSYRVGHVTEAIALVAARTDTRWAQMLFDLGQPICFIRGRLKFSGSKNSATFPSMVAYLGRRPSVFIEVFAELGEIRGRYEPSPTDPHCHANSGFGGLHEAPRRQIR